jgi:hypothetical protein
LRGSPRLAWLRLLPKLDQKNDQKFLVAEAWAVPPNQLNLRVQPPSQ